MKNSFLKKNGLVNAEVKLLAGDASFRKYYRITQPQAKPSSVFYPLSFVLMESPPDKENIRPFLHIADYLCDIDLSAPRVIDYDIEQGLILMEDLGDDLYSSVLKKDSTKEEKMYSYAIDTLVDIHNKNTPPIQPYFDDLFINEVALFTDWYLTNISLQRKNKFLRIWTELLPIARLVPDGLILRDYHADNLIWLPDRKTIKKVGLLDFQDAVIGPVTYDIVSLLEDARRDVSEELATKMIDRYLEKTGVDRDTFLISYAIMAAQRNIKIIGIFNRLCKRDNKPQYLDYLPRMWGYLKRDLEHPILNGVKEWIENNALTNNAIKNQHCDGT